MIFSRKEFESAIGELCEKYEKSAPTVYDWVEWLYQAKDHEITLSDVFLLKTLASEDVPPNYAANMLYHMQYKLGRDTTGNAGF